MNYIISFIVLLLCFFMFIVKRETKIKLCLIYTICLKNVFVFGGNSWLTIYLFFFLSEIIHFKHIIGQFSKKPFNFFITICLLAMLISFVTSPHYLGEGVVGIARIFKSDIVDKYFLIGVAAICLIRQKYINSLQNACFISLLILTFFGLFNILLGEAVFLDWATSGADLSDVFENASEKYSNAERFRVQSMFLSPFDYGFTNLVLFYFFLYGRKVHALKDEVFFIAMGCCSFGIVACGCRTLILCLIISWLIYIGVEHKASISIRYLLMGIVVASTTAIFVPQFKEKIESITSMFDPSASTEVESSSLQMRMVQIAAVGYYIRDDLAFGRGRGFFKYDLGWEDGKKGLQDRDLAGMEGVYLIYLLESGIVGFSFYMILWCGLLFYLITIRKTCKHEVSMCISILICYLLFSFMTGEQGSCSITCLLLGIGIRQCQLAKQ